jgi:UDP-N-acetylmuramoyl-tripeptide--D-alanyl-D-alanine ligase
MFTIDEILKATGARLTCGARNAIVRGISIDTRTLRKGEAFIAIKGDTFDGHAFIQEALKKGATCIISERRCRTFGGGVSFIEAPDTMKALGGLARFRRRQFSVPVIAITGSNGKTTTKDMVWWVLSKRMRVLKNEGTKNNQIGVPLTLLNLTAGHDAAVVELGTSHPGEIRSLTDICEPNVGIVTNVGPAHLEFFGTVSDVFREKYTLIQQLRAPALALVNADDEWLRPGLYHGALRPFLMGFGINSRSDFFASRLARHNGFLSFMVNHRQRCVLKTSGAHNVSNALAACAVARVFGMTYSEIAARLGRFRFPAGRLQDVTCGGIRFIDDTYNANPRSVYAALKTLDAWQARGRKILVMGDMLELGSGAEALHAQIGEHACRVCDCFIAVGKLAEFSARAAAKKGMNRRNIFLCASSRQARRLLRTRIRAGSGDIVLVKGSRAMKMKEVLK